MKIKNLILLSSLALMLSACGGDDKKDKGDKNASIGGFGNKASVAEFPSSCDAGKSLFKTKDDLDSLPTGLFRMETKSTTNGVESPVLISCQKIEDVVGGRMLYLKILSDGSLTKSFVSSSYIKELEIRRIWASGKVKYSEKPEEITSTQFNSLIKSKPLVKFAYYNESGDLVSQMHMVSSGDKQFTVYSMAIIKLPNKSPETKFTKVTIAMGDNHQDSISYKSELVEGKIIQNTSGSMSIEGISVSWKTSQTIWKLK